MFGISKQEVEKLLADERKKNREEIRTLERSFKNKLEDLERRLSGSGNTVGQEIRFTDVSVSRSQFLDDVVSALIPKIDDLMKESVSDLDLGGLSDRLYRDIDNDEMIAKLAEILKDKVFADLDRSEVAKAVAEVMNDEGMLDDDFMELLTEKLVTRLKISVDDE